MRILVLSRAADLPLMDGEGYKASHFELGSKVSPRSCQPVAVTFDFWVLSSNPAFTAIPDESPLPSVRLGCMWSLQMVAVTIMMHEKEVTKGLLDELLVTPCL